jgi:general stress protein 26
MQVNQQFNFVQQKIEEIGTAIFFNLSDSVLKFPTTIVSTLKVDDFGFVWLLVQKPKQSLREFEEGFPVRLDFYKKGKDYFLQVSGKAWVVTDPEEINALSLFQEDIIQKMDEQMVLVKVKMQKADYHEIQPTVRNSWWHNTRSVFTALFKNSNSYQPSTYYATSYQ